MDKEKQVCPRCNGSGHFSYHLTYGTVCFQCNGEGFIMVDIKRQAYNKQRQVVKKQQNETYHKLRGEWYETRLNTFIDQYGDHPEFIKRMEGRDPHGNGNLLAQDLCRYFIANNLFTYDIPEPLKGVI